LLALIFATELDVLSYGFALEFVHEQIAETLEDAVTAR
jgi:hypothetical protein